MTSENPALCWLSTWMGDRRLIACTLKRWAGGCFPETVEIPDSAKVVIVRYQFYSDILKTSPIYYFMLLEYMCEVSKLMTIQKQRKLSLKKRVKKRLNTESPMLREIWTTFSITVNKCFLPLQWNFSVRLTAVSHFVSQNLQAIDHPVPEINNYHNCHMAFLHKYTWIL